MGSESKIVDLISVAPMLDITDCHCRYFFRLMSKSVYLYTEMIVAAAVLHGNKERFLAYDEIEHPVVLQLAGNDSKQLAECAKIGASYRYDEINLNIGCPSSRVQAGGFGASLMMQPKLAAECVRAMQDAVSIPVTVKTRLGIDDLNSYEDFVNFVDLLAKAGCKKFIIHARAAQNKQTPKYNRNKAELKYDYVYKLKQDFSQLFIVLNGGIKSSTEIRSHLNYVDGVMIGSQVCHEPYMLASIDQEYYGCKDSIIERSTLIEKYLQYTVQKLKQGVSPRILMRPLMGIYNGMSGAKEWRTLIAKTCRDAQIERLYGIVHRK